MHQLYDHMYVCCQLTTRSLCNCFVLWVIHKAFDKYQLSMEIDIKQLVAYACKMDLKIRSLDA